MMVVDLYQEDVVELEEDQVGLFVYLYYEIMNFGEDQLWIFGLLQVYLMWVQIKIFDVEFFQIF